MQAKTYLFALAVAALASSSVLAQSLGGYVGGGTASTGLANRPTGSSMGAGFSAGPSRLAAPPTGSSMGGGIGSVSTGLANPPTGSSIGVGVGAGNPPTGVIGGALGPGSSRTRYLGLPPGG